MNNLEKRVGVIEKRNLRVEADKKWETSWTRRLSIGLLTYIVIAVYLLGIRNDKPYLNAFIPAMGYILSTLVLKSIRSFWQDK